MRQYLNMKLIILRGLPGVGKSVIADKLAEKLNNSTVIHVDDFKVECRKKHKDYNFGDVCKYSYEKTLQKLSSCSSEEVIIIEEIFDNKDFVNNKIKFCKENNIESYWFHLKRDIKKLLEVENKRKRKIKNTLDDFETLQNNINKVKIANEKTILNNGDIDNSVNAILNASTR